MNKGQYHRYQKLLAPKWQPRGSGTQALPVHLNTHFLGSHNIPNIKWNVLYFFKASHIISNENNQKQMQTIFL